MRFATRTSMSSESAWRQKGMELGASIPAASSRYEGQRTRTHVGHNLTWSVRHTRGLWQNDKKIYSDLYTIWKPSFLRRRMVGEGRSLLPEILGQLAPRSSKIADFEPIIARSASAVTPSEKSSINATRFPMSLRWSSYVAPKSPKGVWKTQNGRFVQKIGRRLKKVCYKVCLCENIQRKSCNAFICLTNRAKMIGQGDPLYLKFWIKVTALVRNRRFSLYFRS